LQFPVEKVRIQIEHFAQKCIFMQNSSHKEMPFDENVFHIGIRRFAALSN